MSEVTDREKCAGRVKSTRWLRCLGGAALLLMPLASWARDISVQEAIAMVQHETSGKVLSAQTLRLGKRKIYRIKVLTPEGQVRIVQVRAEQ